MASNPQRHAAKAVRRKRELQTRRAAIPVSLAAKVQHFAKCPVYRCLIQPEMFATGIGTVFLARRSGTDEVAMAAFLVDTYALGVKDVTFAMLDRSEFDEYVEMANLAAPVQAVEPGYARKLLRDVVAYAASLGLRPHRGFIATELLFGDVRPENCAEEFSFGRNGKPVYVPSPMESSIQVERRLRAMVERLGPSGFDIVLPIGADDDVPDEEAMLSLFDTALIANEE